MINRSLNNFIRKYNFRNSLKKEIMNRVYSIENNKGNNKISNNYKCNNNYNNKCNSNNMIKYKI